MTGPLVPIAVLAAVGVLPAVAVARLSAVVVFLAPLIGAGITAVAAIIELAAGGSIVADFVGVAATVNLAVIAWWVTARIVARRRTRPPRTGWRQAVLAWIWAIVTVAVIAGCLVIPLVGLHAPMFGWDANSIWLTHALMMYGGHNVLESGLQNPAYLFTNPDYPPLTPAAGALAFKFSGLADLHLFVDMTTVLSACALGVLGAGIAAAAGTGRTPGRIAGVAAAGAVCLAGFAVSGYYAIEGYADLMWAAAAAAAVIWGLVLPRDNRSLGVAWICAAVASLTKNEGLTTALVIIVLIALRYRPLSLPRRAVPGQAARGSGVRRLGSAVRPWAERAGLVVLPALPGLAWAATIRLLGLHAIFFQAPSGQSLLMRAQATATGMAPYLKVVPVAAVVLLFGFVFLRRDRRDRGLGNPAWLWLCCLISLGIIFATYVFGWIEIHGWLAASVSRTTIFAQVLLYSEIAVWVIIAADGSLARAPASLGERPPEVVDRPREPLAERDPWLPAQ